MEIITFLLPTLFLRVLLEDFNIEKQRGARIPLRKFQGQPTTRQPTQTSKINYKRGKACMLIKGDRYALRIELPRT